jgi:hypothetical protein
MYGTIARLQPLPGREAELADYGRRTAQREVSGYRGSYLFTPDHNPYKQPTVFLIALFDDEASYHANADSPDQHESYLEMRALLAVDPEWMDGTFEEG